MKTGWMAAALLAVVALAWWLARGSAPGPAPELREPNATPPPSRTSGRVLYRWRDAAGVVQVTDAPPGDRAYETVDVDALDRRNRLDARLPAAAPE
jgi:hypothetical protein